MLYNLSDQLKEFKMHYIIFPIGDWSCDGHSCYADFLVKSDKPLQEVREIHFRENDFIGSLCSDYRDNKIEVFSLYNFMIKYMTEAQAQENIKYLIIGGVDISDEELEFQELQSRINKTKFDYKIELSFEENENCQSLIIDDPKIMLDIWLMCLNAIDPKINLECVSEAMSQYYIKHKGYKYEPEENINFYPNRA